MNVAYVAQNQWDVKSDAQFDLIMMIMCDFCALSPSQRTAALLISLSLLAPGGSVLLDVYSPKAFEQREEASSSGVNLLDGFRPVEKYYGSRSYSLTLLERLLM